jgi:hypothetical protein
MLARVFLVVSIVWIRQYVEKDGAIVGVPELATRFADPSAVVLLAE